MPVSGGDRLLRETSDRIPVFTFGVGKFQPSSGAYTRLHKTSEVTSSTHGTLRYVITQLSLEDRNANPSQGSADQNVNTQFASSFSTEALKRKAQPYVLGLRHRPLFARNACFR